MTGIADARPGLDRRLANFRAGLASSSRPERRPPGPRGRDLADSLAQTVGGEVVRTERGAYVRVDAVSRSLPLDRTRLARLPGQPPADVPLLCLDTETTGLATAAGTLAFLVGLGWWVDDTFHQVQLVLPDQPDEPALLDELADRIPPKGWLVTYNGRGFDWPLLVARFRLARRGPPEHAGHLDLLPLVRRVFRHRMTDARLRTVESDLLGTPRHEGVEGWEIPSRYLAFLRAGAATGLVDVLEHNTEDVLSLARFLAHVEQGYADDAARARAPRGDLAGLARAFARERRLEEALGCLDSALLATPGGRDPFGGSGQARPVDEIEPVGSEWWSSRRSADFGGRPQGWGRGPLHYPSTDRLADPWTEDRIARERGHVLRRLGRYQDAIDAFCALGASGGAVGIAAWIEAAKLREHRMGDPAGAFEAVRSGWRQAERCRALGRPLPRLEADLARRGQRLRERLLRQQQRVPVAAGGAA